MKTKAGTQLQIIKLKNKDYMMVHQRLVWFREEHPNWSIETEFVTLSDKGATAKATIKDETGKVIATAHKQENTEGFGDFMEKAETGAVGRALLLCGYGTAFAAAELDEGERIVDSPIEKSIENAKKVVNEENKKLQNLKQSFSVEILNIKINDAILKYNPEFKGLTYKEAAEKSPERFGVWISKLLANEQKKPDNQWKDKNIANYKLLLDYVVTVEPKQDEIPF
jgi:hypothetical protein